MNKLSPDQLYRRQSAVSSWISKLFEKESDSIEKVFGNNIKTNNVNIFQLMELRYIKV